IPPPPPKIRPSPPQPPSAESSSLGNDQIASEVNSLEALVGDETGKLGERWSPSVRDLRLSHHLKELVRMWKHPNSHVCRAGRYEQQPSATVGTPMRETWIKGGSIFFLSAAVGVKPDKPM
ncbi:unnamed protein product, partial [Ascophyllum nodosum]